MMRKAFSALVALSFSPLLLDQPVIKDYKRHAICLLYPHNSNVRGIVSFSQDDLNNPMKISCAVKGLNANKKHGISIHEYGDLIQGTKTTGDIFNPHRQFNKGPIADKSHVGDLGNLPADQNGQAYISFTDSTVSLYGQYSIAGRSVVVYANENDRNKTEMSDEKLACGVIGLAKQFKSVPAPPASSV